MDQDLNNLRRFYRRALIQDGTTDPTTPPSSTSIETPPSPSSGPTKTVSYENSFTQNLLIVLTEALEKDMATLYKEEMERLKTESKQDIRMHIYLPADVDEEDLE